MVPRYLPELAEFRRNELETHCGRISDAYSSRYCSGDCVFSIFPKWHNTENASVNVKFLVAPLFSSLSPLCSLSSYLYVCLFTSTSSASLSGRKPQAFGSYMKYESESHWMRIVRSCRWNQSQQQWGVTSARLSFNLRELQAPYSPP